MIPVERQEEPALFQNRVSGPGADFLRQCPQPTTRQFKSHAYWGRVSTDLYNAYAGICAYSCHWIPPDTGSDTVEHFMPKSLEPAKAYEWENYRLVCGRLNGRKGIHQDVLDPFEILSGTFELHFPSLLVKPGSEDPEAAWRTIDRLKLNDDETTLRARWEYVRCFCQQEISFRFLTSHAPFIARELERQGIVERLSEIMGLSSM